MERKQCGLLLLTLLAAFLHTGSAIHCFSCASEDTAEGGSCLTLKQHETPMVAVNCTKELFKTITNNKTLLDGIMTTFGADLHSGAEPQFQCLKIRVTMRDRVQSTARMCYIQEESFDICDKIKEKMAGRATVDYCGICGKDGCNSAPTALSKMPLIGYLTVTCALLMSLIRQ